jgi:hypothetical protein
MAGSEGTGYPGVIAGRNTTTEQPDDLGMDQDSRSLNVNLWVWNTGTLGWEKLQRPLYGKTEDALNQVLIELKIMNKYLSALTKTQIKYEDLG